MSQPKFPEFSDDITREDVINHILISIAMEELGLSHIINAEGEKLQYILGTLPGISGPGATIEQVLEVNKSVQKVLETVSNSQLTLKAKMNDALSASVMQGPTGATGPAGPTGPSGDQTGTT